MSLATYSRFTLELNSRIAGPQIRTSSGHIETSYTDLVRIAEIAPPTMPDRIGLTLCPGKKDRMPSHSALPPVLWRKRYPPNC